MKSVGRSRVLLFAVLVLPASLSASRALAAENVAAMAARAQAAFFARDAAALSQLLAATSSWTKSTDPRELYAHAYLQFRAEQLAALAGRKSEVEKAGNACVAATDAALERDAKFAEAHALQSACHGYLAGLGGFGAIRNGRRSGKAIEAALALEPRNPRVLLTDAFGLHQRPKIAGGDRAKGCAKFREAAAAFGTAAAATPGIDWGAAEAHYWVGRCATEAGDAAAARAAYGRALALAPDFAAAGKALGGR